MNIPNESSVLSIQSWVSHGYVGNRCSVFALQLLGIECDAIHTVHFSNHTGYATWKGDIFDGAHIDRVWQGLKANNLSNYSHLLTGYVNSASCLRTVVDIFKQMKETNPNLVWACDPVMGDDGKLYVSKDLVAIYRDEVIAHADFLFPNQTECEVLTGLPIKSVQDAIVALNWLHDKGIPNVIITSLNLPESHPSQIVILGSSKVSDKVVQFQLTVPKIIRKEPFFGTGDLFAALVVAWSTRGDPLIIACEKAVNTLQSVLHKTFESNSFELKLVQAKNDIENPTTTFQAKIL